MDIVNDLVTLYEDISNHICAITGEYYEGKIDTGGWIYDASIDALKKKFPERAEYFENAFKCISIRKDIISHVDGLKRDELESIARYLNNEAI